MDDARFIVGIDLGTTNIAVFYADTETKAAALTHLRVPQVTAAGETDARELLPSFTYLPGGAELPAGALTLPWDREPSLAVGEFARRQGARVPARLVSSAKSWLAHAGVDRSTPILPWGSELGDQKRSPVAVTALYLDHVRAAWNHEFGRLKDRHGSPCRLEEQQVTITIPASFDETARELTIAAAREAGYRNLTLLEEPLAAFYAWLSANESTWQSRIQPGQRVLVIDVGGGTTDFSFMEVDEGGALHRFAVGDHLLLGGDNIDMAIARGVEQGWGTKLNPTEWAMLVQLCRQGKEDLLDGEEASVDVTLIRPGSSVLAGTRKATLTRETLGALLEDGFYPRVGADEPPPRRSSGMREMGLPYAQEPAVTRHLLQFLRYAAAIYKTRGEGQGQAAPEGGWPALLYPDFVLFNGGSMKAPLVRARVAAVLAGWFPERPAPVDLEGAEYSLAVARGAAYYGRVRRGDGVKVRGGIARAYYLEAAAPDGTLRRVCVMPRETEESVDVPVPGSFQAHTNDKVRFTLYSSATRLTDRVGQVLGADEELSLVAPLVSVLQYGKSEKRAIDVQLHSRLTEVGALELTLASVHTQHRWPLRFDLRPIAETASPDGPGGVGAAGGGGAQRVVDADTLAAAQRLLQRAYGDEPELLKGLLGDLETTIDLPREEWSIALLRDLADTLLALADERGRTPQHETRWLNLLGFCLRPGFGDAADDLRMRTAWKLWFAGPQHDRQPQNLADWWVFWRRVAPGLKSGHQTTIANTLMKTLCPKGAYRTKIREGDQAQREMWRCLGALELLSAKTKTLLGDLLIERAAKLLPHEYWVLARLGARRPFRAPANALPSGKVATLWVRALQESGGDEVPALKLFALSRLAAHTGDRHLDLPDSAAAGCRDYLVAHNCPAAWLQHLEQDAAESSDEQTRLLGDSLPIGLVMRELES